MGLPRTCLDPPGTHFRSLHDSKLRSWASNLNMHIKSRNHTLHQLLANIVPRSSGQNGYKKIRDHRNHSVGLQTERLRLLRAGGLFVQRQTPTQRLNYLSFERHSAHCVPARESLQKTSQSASDEALKTSGYFILFLLAP